MQLTSSGSNYDSAKVWFDPTATANLDTPGGDGFATVGAGTGMTSISHLLLRQAVIQTDDVFLFDNVVVGTQFSDVVSAIPEPGSLSLLGGFGLALLARRRRS